VRSDTSIFSSIASAVIAVRRAQQGHQLVESFGFAHLGILSAIGA